MVDIHIKLPPGLLTVHSPQRRIYTPTTFIFLSWMLGSSIVLSVIALMFMRNQIRPIRRLAVVGHQPGTPRGDIHQPVPNLANGRHMVRAPLFAIRTLHGVDHVPKKNVQVGKRTHLILVAAQQGIAKWLVDHPRGHEVDQGVGFGIDIVLVQQDFGVLHHLAQSPGEGQHIVLQCRV